ncbi:MAG: hypothetical protein R6X18_17910 [Chloroflexota bacterium]
MTEETRELIITGDPKPDEPAGESDWVPVAADQDSYVYEISPPTSIYYAPRGKWDFTDSQLIVIGLLIWLNIIILFVGYLAITGQVSL